ncbi:MAG: ATP-binding protein [Atopobiaceae bacterium]|nr:ATP-binding protein [Atopobiaceae bacterium]
MLNNPFSPIFGGKPDFFFGRKDVLRRFDLAMRDRGSEDRALFFTGTRGCGKTALLEQLSTRASREGRVVVDLGPDDTVAQLIQALVGHSETTTTVSPQASISILGTGGSLSAGSVSTTTHYGRESLPALLVEACGRANKGMLVTLDEVQKVPLDDVSAICNAFQMASRKGHDIMLAVAGLPYAHGKIIHHDGCTYLRRASHEEIGLFTWEEAEGAFADAFAYVEGLSVHREEADALNEASYGHPYLMQLLGYHLVTHVDERDWDGRHVVNRRDVDEVVPMAVRAYERRALKPLVDELSDLELKYLRAMSECLDEERLAATGVIAQTLGVESRRLSRARSRLIDNGTIAAPARGQVMFCVPYLADYVRRPESASSAIEIARQRRV